MIALEIADLILIASRTLVLDTSQVLDLVDCRPGAGIAVPTNCAWSSSGR